MKLLKERYKTCAGADKRARFENGLARGEYERGDKARHYRYAVVFSEIDNNWRVQRTEVK